MTPIRKNPHVPFKIDQYFANPTSYGPHEGWDTNGLGGGNTDCGTLLYPLCAGVIVSATSSTSGYGKLIIYEVQTPRGPRYIRYAHCQEFLVTVGQQVSQDTPIALMGSTGNSTACHLHWDILSKKPTSWRFYAKTKAEQDEWFINPQEFLSVYKDGIPLQSTTGTMPENTELQDFLAFFKVKNLTEARDVWLKETLFLEDERKKTTNLQAQLDDHQRHIEELSTVLGTTADYPAIKAEVTHLLAVEETNRQLEKKLEAEEKKHDMEINQQIDRINSLQLAVEEAQRNNEKLLVELDAVKTKLSGLEAEGVFITRLQKILQSIFKRTA